MVYPHWTYKHTWGIIRPDAESCTAADWNSKWQNWAETCSRSQGQHKNGSPVRVDLLGLYTHNINRPIVCVTKHHLNIK